LCTHFGADFVFLSSQFSPVSVSFLSARISLRTSGVLAEAGLCLFTFTMDYTVLGCNKKTQNTKVSYGSLGFCCLSSPYSSYLGGSVSSKTDKRFGIYKVDMRDYEVTCLTLQAKQPGWSHGPAFLTLTHREF